MFESISKHRFSSLMRAVAAIGLLVLVTACGSLGGDSKETPPPPTATVWPTQQPEIPATAVSTPAASSSTVESSPVTMASPAASPAAPTTVPPTATTVAAEAGGATPNALVLPTEAPTEVAPTTNAATPALNASTPVSSLATPAAATPVAASTPAAALIVTSCEPNEVPQFTGTNPDYIVKEDLNFRVGPGSDCDAIGDPLAQGVHLTVVSDPVAREDSPDRWVQVNVDGQIGWVALEFIEPVKP